MSLASLMVMGLCTVFSIIIGFIIFGGSADEKRTHMHYEICNRKDCYVCLDKEQCPDKREGKDKL